MAIGRLSMLQWMTLLPTYKHHQHQLHFMVYQKRRQEVEWKCGGGRDPGRCGVDLIKIDSILYEVFKE